MEERFDVIVSKFFILISHLCGLVGMLLQQGFERAPLVHEVMNCCGVHLVPEVCVDESLVLWEKTHGKSGSDHDVRSLGNFFCPHLFGLLFVVESGRGQIWLLLSLNLILI